MTTRTEATAQTRQALLDAAGALLDQGGPAVVTLREVGLGAGVSRSAAYRHFDDKNALLAALAADAWSAVAEYLESIAADDGSSPETTLQHALEAMSDLGRARPHLYRLMFAQPADASDLAVSTAAGLAQDAFVTLVRRMVGNTRARQYAGVLMAAAHGISDLNLSGHLPPEKWGADRDDLIALLIEMIPRQ